VKIRGRKLHVLGATSDYPANSLLRITFAKGDADNPKVNALVVMRGTVNDVPRLGTPLPPEEENDDGFMVDDADDDEHV
jgi:hypothetical protein